MKQWGREGERERKEVGRGDVKGGAREERRKGEEESE